MILKKTDSPQISALNTLWHKLKNPINFCNTKIAYYNKFVILSAAKYPQRTRRTECWIWNVDFSLRSKWQDEQKILKNWKNKLQIKSWLTRERERERKVPRPNTCSIFALLALPTSTAHFRHTCQAEFAVSPHIVLLTNTRHFVVFHWICCATPFRCQTRYADFVALSCWIRYALPSNTTR